MYRYFIYLYSYRKSDTYSYQCSYSNSICNNTAQNYTITSAVSGTTYTWSRASVTGISNAALTGQGSNPITETLINAMFLSLLAWLDYVLLIVFRIDDHHLVSLKKEHVGFYR